jgi:cytochrome P450
VKKEEYKFLSSLNNLLLSPVNYLQYTVVGQFEGRQPRLIVLDPELIKQIMVRDFQHFVDRPTIISPYMEKMLINLKGQDWKSVRALLTPSFSSAKLKAMENLVEQCGKHMETFLQNECKYSTHSLHILYQ